LKVFDFFLKISLEKFVRVTIDYKAQL
jgi:hypothetical protein